MISGSWVSIQLSLRGEDGAGGVVKFKGWVGQGDEAEVG